MNSGYEGNKMSKRAVAAYSNMEMPLSKWNKKIVVEEIADELDLDVRQVVLLKPYREYLKKTSWHHTGMLFNETDFYSLDYNLRDIKILDINDKKIVRQQLNELNTKLSKTKNSIEAIKNNIAIMQEHISNNFSTLKIGRNGGGFGLIEKYGVNIPSSYLNCFKDVYLDPDFKKLSVTEKEIILNKAKYEFIKNSKGNIHIEIENEYNRITEIEYEIRNLENEIEDL